MAAFDPMAFGPQAQEVAKQGRPDGGIKREQFASRRSDSLVLQAELGDILYLPAFFWHFVYGNPTEPTFSAHLIIGDSSSRLLDSVHVEPCSA